MIVTRRFVWLGLLSDEATTTDLVVVVGVVVIVDVAKQRAPLRLKALDAAVRASCSPLDDGVMTLTFIATVGAVDAGGTVEEEEVVVVEEEEYLLLWWV